MSLLLSAASTALPDKKEISLSEDGPPIKTATFPNSLMRFPRFASTYNADGRLLRPPAPAAPQHRVGLARPSTPPPFRTRSCSRPDNPHFGLQHDAGLFGDDFAHMRDQGFDIGRACLAIRIDDEVRVLLRNRSSADGMPLKAAGFD